jgi:pSer/pThr/pTyr-binding forkhead associated (FHA) protein
VELVTSGPHLVLEVRRGSRRGRKVALRPGESASVGRTDLSDLVLPDDEKMSPRHFELLWDGREARVRDLGSAAGTSLGGEPPRGEREPRAIAHGGWIRAGTTDFTVHVEGLSPAPEEEDDDEQEDEDDEEDDDTPPPFAAEPAPPSPEDELDAEERAAIKEFRRQISASQAVERRMKQRERERREEAASRALPILQAAAAESALHVVLDAARSPRILQVLREAVEEHRSLYEGAQSLALEEVAPYEVSPAADSRLLAQLVREGWGRRWGIYLEGSVPQRELRRHLRRFLMVEDERGEPLYFRYYDPVVLRDLWPTCSRRQITELLGPLRSFLVEGARGEVLRLTPSGKVEPA